MFATDTVKTRVIASKMLEVPHLADVSVALRASTAPKSPSLHI